MHISIFIWLKNFSYQINAQVHTQSWNTNIWNQFYWMVSTWRKENVTLEKKVLLFKIFILYNLNVHAKFMFPKIVYNIHPILYTNTIYKSDTCTLPWLSWPHKALHGLRFISDKEIHLGIQTTSQDFDSSNFICNLKGCSEMTLLLDLL